ncbi:MAG: NAD(P)H-quinone oxidoreductase [Propionibacteriaceae bacterium]|jgi:putative PIG3 family NAD(P)H quinone oxidoreductase|nr:NAD(P)H-quinone oxidoreductase [Propionibacteriaceae bacterium]
MFACINLSFGGPEVLEWLEVPTPTPGPGEVLIEVVAAGVNRADLLQRTGNYPPPPGISDIIGLEVSGHIAGLGEGVTTHAVGDPVVAFIAGGGYAQYVTCPAGQAVAPPNDVDLVSAAGLMSVAGTVVSNMDRVGLKAGDVFLAHGGAGGIGSFAIQYGKALGATVATTAGSPEKLEYCRWLGADIAIDYHDEWWDALKVATDDYGADIILDLLGGGYLEHNMDVLAPDGRLVIIGMQKGTKGEINIAKMLGKRATVMATSIRQRPVAQKCAIVAAVAERVWPLIETGQIQLSPETLFPLYDAARAHEFLASGDNIGKIILVA